MNIKRNPNWSVSEKGAFAQRLVENHFYCPCRLEKTEDTKCPCVEFKNQETSGECYCGFYIKEEV